MCCIEQLANSYYSSVNKMIQSHYAENFGKVTPSGYIHFALTCGIFFNIKTHWNSFYLLPHSSSKCGLKWLPRNPCNTSIYIKLRDLRDEFFIGPVNLGFSLYLSGQKYLVLPNVLVRPNNYSCHARIGRSGSAGHYHKYVLRRNV